RVLRRHDERAELINERHAALPSELTVGSPIDAVAHMFHPDRPSLIRFDDEDVGMDRAGDARARGAPAARVGVSGGRLNGTRTIERLRHGDSGRALPGRRRTSENQAGRERATVNGPRDRKSTRLNSSHDQTSYAV